MTGRGENRLSEKHEHFDHKAETFWRCPQEQEEHRVEDHAEQGKRNRRSVDGIWQVHHCSRRRLWLQRKRKILSAGANSDYRLCHDHQKNTNYCKISAALPSHHKFLPKWYSVSDPCHQDLNRLMRGRCLQEDTRTVAPRIPCCSDGFSTDHL